MLLIILTIIYVFLAGYCLGLTVEDWMDRLYQYKTKWEKVLWALQVLIIIPGPFMLVGMATYSWILKPIAIPLNNYFMFQLWWQLFFTKKWDSLSKEFIVSMNEGAVNFKDNRLATKMGKAFLRAVNKRNKYTPVA